MNLRLLAILLLPGLAWAQPTILKKDVSSIINLLAADDMEGRKAGTEGAQKAARFIIEEFKKAGLKPMQDMDGFRQSFSMTEITPGEASLVLNGKEIDAADFAFQASGGATHLKDITALKVEKLSADVNPRTRMGSLLRSEMAVLALVDVVHGKVFEQIHAYLSRPKMKPEVNQQPTVIFVLTEIKEVTSLEFKASTKVVEMAFANLVGVLPGKRTKEYVMFSAHYDHLGRIQAVDGDDIANGADDDASGVTALILLARQFGAGPQPERSLLFVSFTAEEMGILGSRVFSKQIEPDQIVAGINIEMIGKPSKFGKGQLFITGFERSDLGRLIQQRLANSEFGLHPDPYPTMSLFFRSDNAPFARLGVPAHSFSTVQIDKDPYYHTVNDEIETLDLDHFTAAIQAIERGVQGLINGEDTPSRLEKKNE